MSLVPSVADAPRVIRNNSHLCISPGRKVYTFPTDMVNDTGEIVPWNELTQGPLSETLLGLSPNAYSSLIARMLLDTFGQDGYVDLPVQIFDSAVARQQQVQFADSPSPENVVSYLTCSAGAYEPPCYSGDVRFGLGIADVLDPASLEAGYGRKLARAIYQNLALRAGRLDGDEEKDSSPWFGTGHKHSWRFDRGVTRTTNPPSVYRSGDEMQAFVSGLPIGRYEDREEQLIRLHAGKFTEPRE